MDHVASTFYDRENKKLNIGFMSLDLETDDCIGRAFNEGYTKQINPGSYEYEVAITDALRAIISLSGKSDELDEAYYSGAGAQAVIDSLQKSISLDDGKINKDGTYYAFGSMSAEQILRMMDTNLEVEKIPGAKTSIPLSLQNKLSRCLVQAFKKQMDLLPDDEARKKFYNEFWEQAPKIAHSYECANGLHSTENFEGTPDIVEGLKGALQEINGYTEFTMKEGKFIENGSIFNDDPFKQEIFDYSEGEIVYPDTHVGSLDSAPEIVENTSGIDTSAYPENIGSESTKVELDTPNVRENSPNERSPLLENAIEATKSIRMGKVKEIISQVMDNVKTKIKSFKEQMAEKNETSQPHSSLLTSAIEATKGINMSKVKDVVSRVIDNVKTKVKDAKDKLAEKLSQGQER